MTLGSSLKGAEANSRASLRQQGSAPFQAKGSTRCGRARNRWESLRLSELQTEICVPVTRFAVVPGPRGMEIQDLQSYTSRGFGRQGIGPFVNSRVSTPCPVVLCPSLRASETQPVEDRGRGWP